MQQLLRGKERRQRHQSHPGQLARQIHQQPAGAVIGEQADNVKVACFQLRGNPCNRLQQFAIGKFFGVAKQCGATGKAFCVRMQAVQQWGIRVQRRTHFPASKNFWASAVPWGRHTAISSRMRGRVSSRCRSALTLIATTAGEVL